MPKIRRKLRANYYLSDNVDQELHGVGVVDEGVGPELAEEALRGDLGVVGAEVGTDVVTVLDAANGVGEGAAAVREADLKQENKS